MPSRRYRSRRRSVRRPLSSFRRLKGKRFGRRSVTARRSVVRRGRRFISKSRGRSVSRGRTSRRRVGRKFTTATKFHPRRLFGTRKRRMPRVSRRIKRDIDIVTHNPLVHTQEERTHWRWAPAMAHFQDIFLGGGAWYQDIMNIALRNWRDPHETDLTLTMEQRALKVKVDSMKVSIKIANCTNATAYNTIYHLYPKRDVLISANTPGEWMNVIATTNAEIIDDDASHPTNARLPMDYRSSPFNHTELKEQYKIRKIKTVRIMPGSNYDYSCSTSFTIDNGTDALDDTNYLFRAKKGFMVLIKSWGEWGIRGSETEPPTAPMLRTCEGQCAAIYQYTTRAHIISDNRKVVHNRWLKDDQTGITLTMDSAHNDSGIYNTYGPFIGTF